MSSSNRQVFQTDTPGRWNRFKWLSRALLIVLICSVVGAALTITSKSYPELPNLNPAPKKLSKKELENLKKTKKFQDFSLDKKEIQELARARREHQAKHPNNKDRINAGFYRPWEAQAYNSLVEHIAKLDMVVSEGFLLQPKSDTIVERVDTGLLHLNKKYKKPVLLTISNYVNVSNVTGFSDSADVERITKNKKLRTGFINSILHRLQAHKADYFKGINLDLDNVKNRNSAHYVAFQKELYATLHAAGYLVTQNVIPDDAEFKLEELQNYNDFIFVMAIDQHNDRSNAGPVSDQRWVEQILDNVCSKIPSSKVILTVTSGGFDWTEGSVGTPIGYQRAISTAQQYATKDKNKKEVNNIIFDPNSANLHFNYTGHDDGLYHTIYFADAATNFNVIRMADDWATGGVALWRLGAEDPRLWTFFQKNLSIDSLRKTDIDIKRLDTVGLNNLPDYEGDGEVLDLMTVPHLGNINVTMDKNSFTITDQKYIDLPTKYVIKKFGYAANKIVLTFDDGPDPDYTIPILDILEREKVPAAFFVVGSMAEKNIQILRREYEDGFEIGNHTFFHPDISTISLRRVDLELNSTRKLIEAVTGRSTILFRPPFNADAEPRTYAEVIPVAESRRESYITIGESIDPWDWKPGITADSIVARVIRYSKGGGSMILLHDAGGNGREQTVLALPRIIEYFKTHGYQFTTIADILGKSKADLMPPIKDEGIFNTLYNIFVQGYFYGNYFLMYMFLTAIFLAMGRVVLIGVLALRTYAEDKKIDRKKLPDDQLPPVSIIVPAYNEEVTVIKTIASLLKTDYPNFEIIFVDDGSKDKTFEMVNDAYGDHKNVTILTKPNGGKASALNFGITHAHHDFVVCIDADTQLKHDAVYHLMAYFIDEEIGAVAGTVKVGNENNLITRWQSIEYITAQNMDRRAFDLLNSITVVPGAIGAFRKSAVFRAGGFTYDTLAEDCDLTMRILRQGFIVKNSAEAIAYTEAPETLNALLKQRFRWSFGVIQSFWKNREVLFNKKYKYFGMVGMPNILIFQIILPLFSPLADLMMVIGLFGDMPMRILIYYVAFVFVDLLVGVLAFWMEKEDYKKLVYIIPQRFIWRQLMYYILFKAIRKALKGELNSWGIIKRTGNVTMKETVKA
jgi:cellulose synthase/poly-beta-1,6-N-acetylglucosamine synthase-like glycosyltransferase/peptidoglycan/xylan/chitin deacetylase (PgdA/CDA1 family)/spore germination protein YaaH